MKKVILILLIIILAFSIYFCFFSKTIILKGSRTDLTLEYNCIHFEPKAETREELYILAENARNLSIILRKEGKYVSLSSLQSALKSRDYRTVEKIIVEEFCKQDN